MSTTVCLTFDFDAYSLWITTLKLVSATPLSRGEYAARVGVPRVLDVLAKHGIQATFFVPGHTAEAFPTQVREIAKRGHEVAAHGYLHETPVGLSRDGENAILARAEDVLTEVIGQKPAGYRSPAWDLSEHTIELLSERGYLYDSSLMLDDFRPHWARTGDRLHPDNRFVRGADSAVVELPVAWELDDFPYFHFVTRPVNPGLRKPSDVLEIWLGEFKYCHEHVANGVFILTMHPEIIGRGPRVEMLSALIGEMKRRPGVTFSTMARAADAFRARTIQ
jgi:peptidoglycan/xylan/chitin deacetylase (PgdA/CDA1 family)